MRQLNTARKTAGKAMFIALGVVAAIIVLLLILVSWGVGVNNNLVRLNQAADAQWATVQAQYQRRLDLIPNLVATVKGAAAQELQLVVGAVRERAKATQIQVNPSDPAQFKQFQDTQAQLSGALSRLLVTVERYPEIKTNQNFLELQSQIEGTENRISVERKRYNETVQAYNNAVLVFPGSLIASFRNFKQRPYFTADVEAQSAPKVDFGASPGGTVPPAGGQSAAPAAAPTTAEQVPPPPAAPSPTKALPPEGAMLMKSPALSAAA
ncbi:MAG: LemA family protein [Candidatus Sumerlaeaceae bacterium]